VTHSVYINDPNGYDVERLYELPRKMWEADIDAGLNYFEPSMLKHAHPSPPFTSRHE